MSCHNKSYAFSFCFIIFFWHCVKHFFENDLDANKSIYIYIYVLMFINLESWVNSDMFYDDCRFDWNQNSARLIMIFLGDPA